jgi:hypothetical protein
MALVTLTEALAAERSKRQQDAADTSTMRHVARTVLEALAERLNAEPIPGWTFLLEGEQIRMSRVSQASRQQVGTWTMSSKMQLVCQEATTEWVTSESYGRVIDEAVGLTAKLIVDTEATNDSGTESSQSAKVVVLPP